MRDLTKSVNRFSWALSLFGLQQLTNVMTPGRAEESTRALDAVSNAAESQLSDAFKRGVQAGDEFQRGVVDLAFGVFNANPGKWVQTGSDALQRSVEALRKLASAGASAASGSSGN